MVVVLVNGVLFAFKNQERSFLRGEELGAEIGLLRQEKGGVFSSVKVMQAQETSWDLQQKIVRQEKLPGFVFLGVRALSSPWISAELRGWALDCFFLGSFAVIMLFQSPEAHRREWDY